MPPAFEIRANAQDEEAPTAPDAAVERVKRGKEPAREGCSFEGSSCDDTGYLLLDLNLADAGSQPELGYVLEARGSSPAELASYSNRPLEPSDDEPGKLRLVWDDGEGHRSYDFDLYVWSVDRAGNMSETPTKLHVESSGSDGCAALSSRQPGSWLLPLLLLLFVRRRGQQPAALSATIRSVRRQASVRRPSSQA